MAEVKIGVGKGLAAMSPMAVFMLLYLVVSLSIGDFYKMPLSVAFVAALIWSVCIDMGKSLGERIETLTRSAGSPNIIYMICVFVLAGGFATVARTIGAVDATVAATLRVLPFEMILPGIFLVACFISLSIGTSVGTVVALTPLAVNLAGSGNGETAMFVAAVLGGAFFGDNLSFISDTTIAATRTQGVAMNVKFKSNLGIVLPAALVTLGVYAVLGSQTHCTVEGGEVNLLLIVPYLLVIVLALLGLNVMVVLVCGIAASFVIAIWSEGFGLLALAGYMGEGIGSMGELIIITLLSAGMLGMIKSMGGIDFLLQQMTQRIGGARGAKACIGGLVAAVNVCTANNTVAIITVGPLAKKIAGLYGITGAKSASLLDTCSCIIQCLLPYGAQTLLAVGLARISPGAPWPYLYYPWALALMVIIAIVFNKSKKIKRIGCGMPPRLLRLRGCVWKGGESQLP